MLNERPYRIALVVLFVMLCSTSDVSAQDKLSPRAIVQFPQLASMPDSSSALQKQIDENDGTLRFDQQSVFRITKTLVFDLVKHGAAKVHGDAAVTIIMDGPGPALRFIGSHEGTASPKSFKPATWRQRMPIVSGIEIVGNHPLADGIELVKTVEPIVSRVAVRWCRHGIHLVHRNRNVVISDCHLYENSGIGIFLDAVNLHQINISNSHVSYNRQGGIVVRDGNVRNVQITGCDIEGNMPGANTPTNAANVLLDVSGTPDDKSQSIAEVAITGCTIQHSANYSGKKGVFAAIGGANIRLLGKEIWPIDSVTISGNIISDTETNLDISHSHDVTVVSNTFFSPSGSHVQVSHSQRVVLNGNTFNPRQFVRPGVIRFRDSTDCILSASSIHTSASDRGALRLEKCKGFVINAVCMTDGGSGIVLRDTSDTTIGNCRISGTAEGGTDLSIDGSNHGILLTGNVFSGKVEIDEAAIEPNP